MAFMRNPLDEEENKKQQTSLQGGVIGAGAPVGPNDSAAKTTGWTSLQKYLEANKGAGGKMADESLAGTQAEVGNTQNAINSWADAASKRANDSTLKDEWSSKIKTGSVDDIAKIDQNAFDAWKNLGNYWGAQDATADSGYDDVFKASQATQDKIKNANTWQGQQQLMKDTYGKSGRYTSGMGTLDTFVARGDAQDKFDAFKNSNANFGDNLKNATTNLNTAKNTGAANYKNVMDAIAARIQSIQADQSARADAANQEANRLADEAYNSRPHVPGVSYDAITMPKNARGFVTHTTGADMATQAEIDALNALGGLDDDVSTGGYAIGSGPKAGFDAQAFQKELEKHIVTSPVKPQPKVTTEQVSAQNSGTGVEGQKITTTYPDGSYDVQGPEGEIIHYNADGTIKSTSGTNIFT
jgi:hypothetical protein